jgi:hypothetical protein
MFVHFITLEINQDIHKLTRTFILIIIIKKTKHSHQSLNPTTIKIPMITVSIKSILISIFQNQIISISISDPFSFLATNQSRLA